MFIAIAYGYIVFLDESKNEGKTCRLDVLKPRKHLMS
jgi:hypothetical protein